MKRQAILLSPLQMEAVRMNHTYTSGAGDVTNPYDFYRPIIDSFSQFAAGPFFWFIMDFSTWKQVCGGGAVAQMTPLTEAVFFDTSIQVIWDITHPDDLPSVGAFTDFWLTYFSSLPEDKKPHMKVSLYFRIKNAEQQYYWIMAQYLLGVCNSNLQWMHGLVIATDISHIKKEGIPMMTILDTSDINQQQFFYTDQKVSCHRKIRHYLTKRETEILQYLAMGYGSKQMASKLKLSVKTINNHRQNMLHKTNTKSSAELVNHCMHQGYLYF